MNSREIFLNVLNRNPADRKPVVNPTSIATLELMDETGCYFPEAHLDAEKMTTLASAGYEILGFDTIAPIFSVVHESAALGCEIDWGAANRMPQVKGILCREPDDIKIPENFLDSEYVQTPIRTIRLIRKKYGDEVAIIGKVFGPWTLAYHLFGVDNFLMGLRLNPGKVRRILDRLKEIPVIFARPQIEAGADAITLADHATGDLCGPEDYRDFLMPIHMELVERMKVPLILHICGDTRDRLRYICETKVTAFHFDSKVDAYEANKIVGNDIILVGNINNPDTLLLGSEEDVRRETLRVMDAGIDMIAPECAVPLETKNINLMAISNTVKESS
ncbi:MAG: MtaA/CmuA family methyltransferase [Actinobacteria bacterium]|nr:MtaA/CmuA family methyltransferase [Actinomycetota bacterium]